MFEKINKDISLISLRLPANLLYRRENKQKAILLIIMLKGNNANNNAKRQ